MDSWRTELLYDVYKFNNCWLLKESSGHFWIRMCSGELRRTTYAENSQLGAAEIIGGIDALVSLAKKISEEN